MKTMRLAIATALYLGAAVASASSLSISPAAATAQPGAGNATTPTPINVAYDNTGYAATDGDSIDAEVSFDATKLTVSVTGSCSAGAGLVIIAAADGLSNRIASGNICVMTFTTAAGAALADVIPLTLGSVIVGSGGAPDPVQPTVTNGAITITAAPPPTPPDLIFSTPGGTIVSGNSFSITPQNGQAGGSATYTCTPAGGVTLNDGDGDGAGSIATSGAAVNVAATCPAGPDGSVSCTHTGGAGSTAQPVTYTIDCPAPPAAVLSSPQNGTTLFCDGQPGTLVPTSATIQNTGNVDLTGVSCATVSPGFAVTTQPSGTIAPAGSSNVTVTCTVPATGTATGTLTCDAGNETPATTLSFSLSSTAQQNTAIFVVPDIIPANSLWSKLGLIGLLAALGAFVAFRRQH